MDVREPRSLKASGFCVWFDVTFPLIQTETRQWVVFAVSDGDVISCTDQERFPTGATEPEHSRIYATVNRKDLRLKCFCRTLVAAAK